MRQLTSNRVDLDAEIRGNLLAVAVHQFVRVQKQGVLAKHGVAGARHARSSRVGFRAEGPNACAIFGGACRRSEAEKSGRNRGEVKKILMSGRHCNLC